MDVLMALEAHGGSISAVQAVEASLRPLLDAGSSVTASTASVKALTKSHGALVMATLKLVGTRLAACASEPGLPAQAYAQLAVSALDALDTLRPALKSKGLELEAQRYTFTRRLMALRLWDTAAACAWRLHTDLSTHPAAAAAAGAGPGGGGGGREATELHASALASVLACASEQLAALAGGRSGGGAAAAGAAAHTGKTQLPEGGPVELLSLAVAAVSELLDGEETRCDALLVSSLATAVRCARAAGGAAPRRLPQALLKAARDGCGGGGSGSGDGTAVLPLLGALAQLVVASGGGGGGDDACAAAGCLKSLLHEGGAGEPGRGGANGGPGGAAVALHLASLLPAAASVRGGAACAAPAHPAGAAFLALHAAAAATGVGCLQRLPAAAAEEAERALRLVAHMMGGGGGEEQEGEEGEEGAEEGGCGAWAAQLWSALSCWGHMIAEAEEARPGVTAQDARGLALCGAAARVATACARTAVRRGATAPAAGLPHVGEALTSAIQVGVSAMLMHAAGARACSAHSSGEEDGDACAPGLEQLLLSMDSLLAEGMLGGSGSSSACSGGGGDGSDIGECADGPDADNAPGLGPEELAWVSSSAANAGLQLLQGTDPAWLAAYARATADAVSRAALAASPLECGAPLRHARALALRAALLGPPTGGMGVERAGVESVDVWTSTLAGLAGARSRLLALGGARQQQQQQTSKTSSAQAAAPRKGGGRRAAAPTAAPKASAPLPATQQHQQQLLELSGLTALVRTLHAAELASRALAEAGAAADGSGECATVQLAAGAAGAAGAVGTADGSDGDSDDSGGDAMDVDEEPGGSDGAGGAGRGGGVVPQEEGGVRRADCAWRAYGRAAALAAAEWRALGCGAAATARAGQGQRGVADAAACSEAVVVRLPAPALNALTQLVQMAHLHGDGTTQSHLEDALPWLVSSPSPIPHGGALRSAWAVMALTRARSCAQWAIAPEPGPAGQLLSHSCCGDELAAALAPLKALRSQWPLLDAPSAARAAATAAIALQQASTASGSGGSSSGAGAQQQQQHRGDHAHVLALAASQCHHCAAGAAMRAGDTVAAFSHSQEALRLASALYQRLSPPEPGTQATTSGSGSGGDVAASSGGGGGHSRPLLLLPALSQYFACLVSSAEALEGLGCSEDARALLGEAAGLARAAGAGPPRALALLRLAQLERARGDPADAAGLAADARALLGGGSDSDADSDAGSTSSSSSGVDADADADPAAGARGYLRAAAALECGAAALAARAQSGHSGALLELHGGLEALEGHDSSIQGGGEGSAAGGTGGAGSTCGGDGCGGDRGWGAPLTWRTAALRCSLLLSCAAAAAASASPSGGGPPASSEGEGGTHGGGGDGEWGLLARAARAVGVGAGAEHPADASGDAMEVDDEDGEACAGRAGGGGTGGARWPLQASAVLLAQGLWLQRQASGSAAAAADADAEGVGAGGARGNARAGCACGRPGCGATLVAGVSVTCDGNDSNSSSSAGRGSGSLGVGALGRRLTASLQLDAPACGVGGATAAAGGRRAAQKGRDSAAARAGPRALRAAAAAAEASAGHPGTEAGAGADADSDGVAHLLRAGALARGSPALLAHAARALAAAALTARAPYAAAMCVHLSTGTSLLHQADMGAEVQRAAAARAAARVHRSGGGGAAASAALDCHARAWLARATAWLPRSCPVVGITTLSLPHRCAAACAADPASFCSSSSSSGGACGCGGGASCARACTCGGGGERLLLSRVERGRAPLLVLLPACADGGGDDDADGGGASSSGGGGAAGGAAAAVAPAPAARPARRGRGAVKAEAGGGGGSGGVANAEGGGGSGIGSGGGGAAKVEGGGGGAADGSGGGARAPRLGQLLSRLAGIMTSSAESMRDAPRDPDPCDAPEGPRTAAAAASIQALKVEWWRSRLALNARMGALLANVGASVIGPWRVLLAPRPGASLRPLGGRDGGRGGDGSGDGGDGASAAAAAAARAAAAAAAEEIARAHFGGGGAADGSDTTAVSVAAEVLELLLLRAGQLGQGELEAVLAALAPASSTGRTEGDDDPSDSEGGGGWGARMARQLLEAHERLGLSVLTEAPAAGQRSEGGDACGGAQAAGSSGGGMGGGRADPVPELARDRAPLPPPLPSARAAATAAAAAAAPAAGRKPRASRMAGLGRPAAGAAAAAADSEAAASTGAAGSAGAGARRGGGGGGPSRDAAPAPAARVSSTATASVSAAPGAAGHPHGHHHGGAGTAPPPVLLVLGPSLHGVPWESCPGLLCWGGDGDGGAAAGAAEVYRSPSLLLSCALAARHTADAAAGASTSAVGAAPAPVAARARAVAGHGATGDDTCIRGGAGSGAGTGARRPVTGAGSVAGAGTASVDGPAPGSGASPGPASATASARVDLASTYYLLNPGQDLRGTQDCFEAWFSRTLRWQGAAGVRPPLQSLLAALQAHSLFVYCGHGSGEQYVPLSLMRRLPSCAAGLLIGCSSGRMRAQGAYDPVGAPTGYLLSGCPALVVNLWDVTDRDIDRFCEALLATWLGAKPPSPPSASSARPPSAAAVDEACGGGARGRGGAPPLPHDPAVAPRAGAPHRLSASVAASRRACKLVHLIGSAPVCYGIPTHVAWGSGGSGGGS
ncbi:hypothetical protein FOA52_000069 [Chlamydomonas sp. UWO 241]|nr:hypothetical protein FOA52_000069 [Chlamydomonas sp. UWO 241]